MSIITWLVKHKLLATAMGAAGIYILTRPKSAGAAIAATASSPYANTNYQNNSASAQMPPQQSGQQTVNQGWQPTPAGQQAMQQNIAAAQQDVQDTKDAEGWAALGGIGGNAQ